MFQHVLIGPNLAVAFFKLLAFVDFFKSVLKHFSLFLRILVISYISKHLPLVSAFL